MYFLLTFFSLYYTGIVEDYVAKNEELNYVFMKTNFEAGKIRLKLGMGDALP